MITPKEPKPRSNVWGVCRGCRKERKFSTKTGTMLPHRKHVIVLGNSEPYGTMVPCEGSGYYPVGGNPLTVEETANGTAHR